MSAIYSLLVVLVVAILLMINSFWLPEAAENGCALCDGAYQSIDQQSSNIHQNKYLTYPFAIA
ncbi:hypothetical protein MNBD_GAMMA10-1300 [hydrothermal vent metagenome]|uniref:Uncharacterized protein n=1 Tax=hydrothermal vent metagenome TaxID=652676 RepID=A0A3B0XJU6_9ZZZZ